MKMLTIISVAALMTMPVAASAQTDAAATIKSTIDCIDVEGAALAKGSKEGADVLADLVIYRCGGDISRQAALRVLPARTMALDRIVRVRMGDMAPTKSPV
jgi:hypothetical protein